MFTDSFGKLSEIFKFSKKEFFYEIPLFEAYKLFFFK